MSDAQSPNLRDVVRRCFFATHIGRSTDDVVIDDDLNAAFIAACLREIPSTSVFDLNWQLYNLRKQPPGIGKVATVKRRDNHDDYVHASEIAARHMEYRRNLLLKQALTNKH